MRKTSLEQQPESSVATKALLQRTNETAAAAATAGDDLLSAVGGWLDAQCVGTWRFTTGVLVLWREFRTWSGRECTQDEFAAGLERRGFVVDRGMVEGLALAEDFLAAIECENERLRNKKAVQLDLFGLGRQDALPNAS